jgi:hypothetical protein
MKYGLIVSALVFGLILIVAAIDPTASKLFLSFFVFVPSPSPSIPRLLLPR